MKPVCLTANPAPIVSSFNRCVSGIFTLGEWERNRNPTTTNTPTSQSTSTRETTHRQIRRSFFVRSNPSMQCTSSFTFSHTYICASSPKLFIFSPLMQNLRYFTLAKLHYRPSSLFVTQQKIVRSLKLQNDNGGSCLETVNNMKQIPTVVYLLNSELHRCYPKKTYWFAPSAVFAINANQACLYFSGG